MDRDAGSRGDFGNRRSCTTKCSTGALAVKVDGEDELELMENQGRGPSSGIVVKMEMVVQEETGSSPKPGN